MRHVTPPSVCPSTSPLRRLPPETLDPINIPVTMTPDQMMTPDDQDDMSVLSTPTVPTPAKMVITLPPDTNLTEFCEWIESSFAS